MVEVSTFFLKPIFVLRLLLCGLALLGTAKLGRLAELGPEQVRFSPVVPKLISLSPKGTGKCSQIDQVTSLGRDKAYLSEAGFEIQLRITSFLPFRIHEIALLTCVL